MALSSAVWCWGIRATWARWRVSVKTCAYDVVDDGEGKLPEFMLARHDGDVQAQ